MDRALVGALAGGRPTDQTQLIGPEAPDEHVGVAVRVAGDEVGGVQAVDRVVDANATEPLDAYASAQFATKAA